MCVLVLICKPWTSTGFELSDLAVTLVAVVVSASFELLLLDVEESTAVSLGSSASSHRPSPPPWSSDEEPLTTLPGLESSSSPKGISPNSVRLMRDSPPPWRTWTRR